MIAFLYAALLVPLLLLLAVAIYTVFVYFRYVPTVVRIFEEKPIFLPPVEPPDPEAESVWIETADGVRLRASWLHARAGPPRGTIIFCHEFLSNRWSCRPYCEPLRASGFTILTFDFRNHGESGSVDGYRASQWVSDWEVADVRAAIEHACGRGSGGGGRIGLLGVSRGGGAAILAAAREPSVGAVATDGAFPTHHTQLVYMMRWVGIYVRNPRIYQLTPGWYYSLVAWVARRRAERSHCCHYPRVEAAAARLAPRRLLMIHGERDGYIVPDIARHLFGLASHPKQLWIVPGAKHNGAIRMAGDCYGGRLVEFFSSPGGAIGPTTA